jgi:S1-C subfamily serine protease
VTLGVLSATRGATTMRDGARVHHLIALMVWLLAFWLWQTAESMAQNETTVTVNVKSLPGKDATKPVDQPIEVVVYNPTSRLMTVDVVYLPLEATDLVIPDADATDNPWKTVRLTIKGETRLENSGIRTKNLTMFYVAQDVLGWYTGRSDANTPTVQLEGRDVHTIAVSLGTAKGFSLPRHPTITIDEIQKYRERARRDLLRAEQPVGSRLLGAIVERTTASGHSNYRIVDVLPGSPAEKYDLDEGNVIFAMDTKRFRSDHDLEASLGHMERTQRTFTLTIRTDKGTVDYQFNPPKTNLPSDDQTDTKPTILTEAPTLGVRVRTRGQNGGAEIVAIVPGSQADRKRLRIGDVITSFLGQRVYTEKSFANLEKSLKPGMRVNLEYLSTRNNRLFNETIEFPAYVETSMKQLSLGVSVRTNPGGGVLVAKVAPGSPLDGVLEPGYIIIELNDQAVRSKAEFDQAARSLTAGQQDISLIFINAAKRPAVRDLRRFSMPGP